ncbi:hypothetical protein [Paraburkholderia kururiensis]|uniref:hypothetical protein n=1 Tax=Paraburkholderia kururiensis TaxID=984307 RepID=UPI0005A5EE3F|nr:hypothetical protein [Paraburkholderia kururiensis]
MAKQSNTPATPAKQSGAPDTGAEDAAKKEVTLNTGAQDMAKGNASETPPVPDTPAVADATLADVGDAVEAAVVGVRKTLASHVSDLLATAEKSGDTASQSVLNRIHVKLAEFRHMVTAIEQHVLSAAHADVQDLVDELKYFL